jgi:hypothetical protein
VAPPLEPWTCPSCSSRDGLAFCARCGETRPDRRHLKLREFLIDVFHAMTDIDGRLLRSFRALLLQPGELTLAYAEGRRIGYLGPLQLFLIANVLFYLAQAATHSNVFASTLDSHLQLQDWRPLARELVGLRLQALGTDLQQYAPRFDAAAVRNAKALVVLMVLPFALVLQAFFPRRGAGLVLRTVFALHLYSMLMVLFSAAVAIAGLEALAGGRGIHSPAVDIVLSTLNLAACILYLYFATGRVYPSSRAVRALKALGLGIIVAAIVVGYRFTIFVITLYTTG